ncbi:hypothetical protein [Aureispira sp. CCB-QB1]|uniref:hypothetical protein n=1 Tax=Aureispira sp. CCB-QB1 TaxID=1313421 RepID=UPI000695D968|nr:hypothetical protein [Aureispira sp. CCB-QB1]
MEINEADLEKLQGGTNSVTGATAVQGPAAADTCNGDPCCTETAQEDCCTYQDTGDLPLSDCDPDGEIADFCV